MSDNRQIVDDNFEWLRCRIAATEKKVREHQWHSACRIDDENSARLADELDEIVVKATRNAKVALAISLAALALSLCFLAVVLSQHWSPP